MTGPFSGQVSSATIRSHTTYGHLFDSEADTILAKLDKAADRHENADPGESIAG